MRYDDDADEMAAYDPDDFKSSSWLDDLLDATDHKPLPFEVDD